MISSAFLAITLMCGAPPTDAELQKRSQQLVAQLGDRSYRERERAAKELLEIGYPAKDAVLAGQSSADGEISERCRKLYPAIFRHDLEKRVAKFLDNIDGPIPDGLPGAVRWIKTVGDGKESRELYAEMVKAHPETLLNFELNPERLRELYAELMREVYTRSRTQVTGGVPIRQVATESEVSLFLFLGSCAEVRTSPISGVSSTYYMQFLSAQALLAKLSAHPPATAFRKLYAAWVERERYSIVARRALDVAAQYGIKECAPMALNLAKEGGIPITYRAMALAAFGRLASKDELKDLEPFLTDKLQIAVVAFNNERGSVQMRDIALGLSVQLAGENLTDFGFDRRPPVGAATVSSYTFYAFANDDKRDAAHAKWKEWAAKNLKK